MKKTLILTSTWVLGSLVALAADAPAPTMWQGRMRAVQTLVRQLFPKQAAGSFYPVTVMETADLSGPGTGDALISLGGGGYTDEVTVVQLFKDAPVAARFHKGGNTGPLVFTTGRADNYGGDVKLLSTDHAVLAGSWEKKNGKIKDCHTDVYQWEEKEREFKYSHKLSKEQGKTYCDALEARLKN